MLIGRTIKTSKVIFDEINDLLLLEEVLLYKVIVGVFVIDIVVGDLIHEVGKIIGFIVEVSVFKVKEYHLLFGDVTKKHVVQMYIVV